MKAALATLGEKAKTAVGAGLYIQANEIMTESKTLVPRDTGALVGSGYVAKPEVTQKGVSVELGYGGAAKDYAVEVHEDLEQAHPDGGQAKYLEEPFNAAAGTALQRVAEVAKLVLAGSPAPSGSEPTRP